MKRFLLIISVLLLLSACSEGSKRGADLGREFIEVWGDTAAMRQTVARFDALRTDSLRWPWEVKAANRAFAGVLIADGRDSIFQASHVIVLSPRELAQQKCPPMIELLLKRQYGPEMGDYLELIHWLCYVVGHDRHVEVVDSTLQAIVDGYSIKEQMTIYAQASRPEALGAALAHDANQPGADMNDINARITALREDIYTPADFSAFDAAYQSALKTKN